jgi:adenylate cyclase
MQTGLNAWTASRPLWAKLVLGMLVVSLAPLLIATYAITQRGTDTLRQAELESLQQIAANIAGRVGQILTDTRRLAAFVADDEAVTSLLDKPSAANVHRAQVRMQTLLAANPDVDLAIVMDARGDALMATEPNSVGRNYRFREYFISAIQGRPYATGIIVGTAVGGAGIYIAHPVQSGKGTVSGIVMIRLTANAVTDIVEDERLNKLRKGYLVDHDGVVIYHPDPTWMQRSLLPLTPDLQKRIANDRRFAKATIDSLGLPTLDAAVTKTKNAGSVQYTNNAGGWIVAGYSPVRVHPWTVVVETDEAAFTAPLRELFWAAAAIVTAVAIVFTLLAWRFALSLTRPIAGLSLSARALQRGDFAKGESAAAQIVRNDELGVLAKTFEQMARTLREREHERDIFGRLVSPEVRDKLIKGDLRLGGEQLRVTVLFTDIRGFSRISETSGAHDVVFMLNEYLTEMADAIKPYGGYINNYVGDAMVVVFGAPTAQTRPEWNAVQAAFAMRTRLAELNARRAARDDGPIDNGIGIASGRAIAGQMGSPERCIYTVIGDTVNIASRIESLTRQYANHPILVNGGVADAARSEAGVRVTSLGPQEIKGRANSVEVFAVALLG